MSSHAKAPSAGSVWTIGAAALAAVFLLLAIAASSAVAAPGHPVVRTFSIGPDATPGWITTDADGNIYVVDSNAARIEKFDSNGNRAPFSATFGYIGENAITGTDEGPFLPRGSEGFETGVREIAVDSSAGPTRGDIYVVRVTANAVEILVFDPSGAFKGRIKTPSGSFDPVGLAVRSTDGSIYQNLNGTVFRYRAPTGLLQNVLPEASLKTNLGTGLGIDVSGAVWTYGYEPILKATNEVQKFEADQFGSASPVFSTVYEGLTRRFAVDPNSGEVYRIDDTLINKHSPAGAQEGAPFGMPGAITVAPDGNVVVGSNGSVLVYGPDELELPAATTDGSSNVDAASADVEGAVDPAGAGAITACEFRYGEDMGYSTGSVPCAPGSPISSPTVVGAHLTGLVSGTTYHYRVFVTNSNGTQMASSEQSFTTPAALTSVSTEAATEVDKDAAVLHGSFEGDGTEAHYFFEWGAAGGYGHTTPVPPGSSAGSGTGVQEVAPIAISGLRGGAKYHYRLVVSTPAGVTRGQRETFVTPAAVTNLVSDVPTTGTETGVDLKGSFEGDGTYETHYYYQWGLTTEYGGTAPAPPGNAVPAATGKVDLLPATISGLKKGSIYHFRVVASNAAGTSVSNDVAFKPAAVPEVEHLDSRAVLATSAELTAEVIPHLAETTYRFEWGPSAAYGNATPVPDGNAGAGSVAVPVSVKLTGLSPDVTYHFRLVATNKFGTSRTVDQTFSFHAASCPNAQLRQETRSNALPDCRAYELVTPSFARGTFIYPERGPVAPLASSPARLAYTGAFGTFSEETGDPSNVLADLYVSTRTDTGWYQKFIGKPANETFMMGGPPGSAVENFATFFEPQPFFTGAQATPDLGKVISYELGWPSNTYGQQGKASNAPYIWDTATGQLLERWPTNLAQVPSGEKFVGWPQASADTSHFVFQSNLIFAPGGTEVAREITCCDNIDPTPLPPASIYDNDLKTGEVKLASIRGDQTTFQGYVFDISENGSHILMSEERASFPRDYLVVERIRDVEGPLYLRADGEHTYEIAPGHKIAYVGSSGDGKTVYLRSADQLTSDDHDSSTDLYVWRQSDEQLTRVSAGDSGGNDDECEATWSGGGCSVEAIERNYPRGYSRSRYNDNPLATASGDIYFVSPEQLVEDRGQEGRANLYLYRNGALQFVAAMNSEASSVKRIEVSPDGKHMAFVTKSNVTDYDSADHTEMYTYDPQSDRVVCASCRPDGQPPTSDVEASRNGLFQTYDGRAFFATDESLTARDTNGGQDIYEFTEGKPQLISTGIGSASRGKGFTYGASTGLVGVTANGSDAYFSTVDVLVSQDHNGQGLKIYDARTGGGYPAERTPGKCTAADECHGPGVSPPAPLADRTSANLGKKAKPKAHKAKHKKKKAHKKKQKQRKSKKKAKAAKGNGKQGRGTRG